MRRGESKHGHERGGRALDGRGLPHPSRRMDSRSERSISSSNVSRRAALATAMRARAASCAGTARDVARVHATRPDLACNLGCISARLDSRVGRARVEEADAQHGDKVVTPRELGSRRALFGQQRPLHVAQRAFDILPSEVGRGNEEQSLGVMRKAREQLLVQKRHQAAEARAEPLRLCKRLRRGAFISDGFVVVIGVAGRFSVNIEVPRHSDDVRRNGAQLRPQLDEPRHELPHERREDHPRRVGRVRSGRRDACARRSLLMRLYVRAAAPRAPAAPAARAACPRRLALHVGATNGLGRRVGELMAELPGTKSLPEGAQWHSATGGLDPRPIAVNCRVASMHSISFYASTLR